jgi:hypothetical protein
MNSDTSNFLVAEAQLALDLASVYAIDSAIY